MKKFLFVVSIVFGVVAIMHLLRVVYGVDVIVGTWDVPMYISVVGLIVLGVLAVLGFHYAKRSR